MVGQLPVELLHVLGARPELEEGQEPALGGKLLLLLLLLVMY